MRCGLKLEVCDYGPGGVDDQVWLAVAIQVNGAEDRRYEGGCGSAGRAVCGGEDGGGREGAVAFSGEDGEALIVGDGAGAAGLLVVGEEEVWVTVVVEVGDLDGVGGDSVVEAGGGCNLGEVVWDGGGEGAVAVAESYEIDGGGIGDRQTAAGVDCCETVVDEDEVGFAVAIDVSHRISGGANCVGVGDCHGRGEGRCGSSEAGGRGDGGG